MKKKITSFGTGAKGEKATLYTFTNKNGMSVSVTDYGANLVNILVPDRNGKLADVCLGYDNATGYSHNPDFVGAFIGRFANRIGGAEFKINGTSYKLDVNDGPNCLHSGSFSYNKVLYEADVLEEEDSISVEFSRLSPDMEQGFPGNLDYTVTYTLTEDNELIIEYFAVSDKPTIINFTNHAYFNLAGHDSGSVLDQIVQVNADAFIPTNDLLIPTGEIRDVTGTPLDFRTPKPLGRDINEDYLPLKQASGYDHCFVLKTNPEEAEKVAELYDEKSGRLMEVFTDLPGIQIYAANFLNVEKGKGKGGCAYKPRDGVCFETEFYPSAVNIPEFNYKPVEADEEFNSITVYKFTVRK